MATPVFMYSLWTDMKLKKKCDYVWRLTESWLIQYYAVYVYMTLLHKLHHMCCPPMYSPSWFQKLILLQNDCSYILIRWQWVGLLIPFKNSCPLACNTSQPHTHRTFPSTFFPCSACLADNNCLLCGFTAACGVLVHFRLSIPPPHPLHTPHSTQLGQDTVGGRRHLWGL